MKSHDLGISFEFTVTSLMCTYYILPIAVQYIRFVGFTILLVLWLMCVGRKMTKSTVSILVVIFLLSFTSVLLLLLTGNVWKDSIIGGVGQLVYFLPLLIFWHYYSRDERRFMLQLMVLSFFMILIAELNTIFVLGIYPNASRVLASSSEESSLYSSLGAGGYGFIYSIVLLIPSMIALITVRKKKIAYIIVLAVSLILQFGAQYMIAITLSIMGILIFFCKKTWQYVALIVPIVLFLFFADDILIGNLLISLSNWFERDTVIYRKIIDVAHYFLVGSLGSSTLGRVAVYTESLNAIRNNPIFGSFLAVTSAGGHSSWLDLFAIYGIVSFPYFYLLFRVQRRLYGIFSENTRSSFVQSVILFWIMGFLNPIHNQRMIGFVIFLLIPLVLSNIDMQASIKANI